MTRDHLPPPPIATRLNSFALGQGLAHPVKRPPTTDMIALAGTVDGLDALELNYPEHFHDADIPTLASAAAKAELAITGVQLRWPVAEFARGAFTSSKPAERERAVHLACEGVDACRALGASHVILWPAHDGYEYPFQMDYGLSWSHAVACYAEVADYAGDIDVSIEFKPAEPRARTLLGSTGSVLALIADAGRSNLHVTLDLAHLLMAGENPAQSVALCLAQGHLRGLQLNDGYAKADDGLMVGTVHLIETLETLFYLARDGYEGTLYFDTDPVREDPVAECQGNVRRTRELWNLAGELVRAGRVPDDDAVAATAAWWSTLVAGHGS